MNADILLLSESELMVTKSWWRELSLISMDLSSISNFIWSISDLRASFSKQIFCRVNFIGSGSVFLIGTYKLG